MFQGRHVDLPLASLPKEEASRVELSLNGRVVTIGTSATLAYLHDAACKGCERGVRAKKRGRKTKQMDTEPYMRDLMGREKARTIRNANRQGRGRGEKSSETGKGGAEDSLLLPVTCTSYVCLPASRSGLYLHSADEAATVLSPAVLLSRFLFPEEFACVLVQFEGC